MPVIDMIPYKKVKKSTAFFLLIILPALLTFQSCKKKRSEMANLLYKETHNKVFRNMSPDTFAVVFKKVFNEERSKMDHADLIYNYYKLNDFKPVFVMSHLFNGDITKTDDYYMHAADHGLSADMFSTDE